MSDDRWLWDRTGPPDEDVARLERVLSPLRQRGDAVPPSAPLPAPARQALPAAPAARVLARHHPRRLAIAAGVGATILGASAWALRGGGGGATTTGNPPPPRGALAATADGKALEDGAWVEAERAPREIVLASVGRVTLDPGARLRVDRVAADAARLYLERGRIEARIGADVRPRLFQVTTDAARCIDLGCRYALDARPDGTAVVRVLTGRVSFEAEGGRTVYVPAGAACVARRGAGPGTPRFEDAPKNLVSAVDAFDAAAGAPAPERRAAAARVLAAVGPGRDTLVAYHLLSDPDDGVAARAAGTLVLRAGLPDGVAAPEGRVRTEDLERWRDHLAREW